MALRATNRDEDAALPCGATFRLRRALARLAGRNHRSVFNGAFLFEYVTELLKRRTKYAIIAPGPARRVRDRG